MVESYMIKLKTFFFILILVFFLGCGLSGTYSGNPPIDDQEANANMALQLSSAICNAFSPCYEDFDLEFCDQNLSPINFDGGWVGLPGSEVSFESLFQQEFQNLEVSFEAGSLCIEDIFSLSCDQMEILNLYSPLDPIYLNLQEMFTSLNSDACAQIYQPNPYDLGSEFSESFFPQNN